MPVLNPADANSQPRIGKLAPRDSSVRSVVLVLQSVMVGGMETHVRYLAQELRRRLIEVAVVAPVGKGFDAFASAVESEGSDVVRLDTDARAGRLRQLRAAFRLRRLVRRRGADVLHLHTGGATGGLFVVAVARLATRAAVVLTEHDVPGERRSRWDHVARVAMDRLLHCLVAVSRRNASLRLERQGVGCRHFVAILNGVPIADPTPAERASNRRAVRREMGIDEGAPVIGSLVRLAPGKGLHDLVHAFARGEAEGARLLLVGEGPLREELEALAAELGVADRIRFAGNRPEPEPYLDAMDVFVLAVPAGSMSIALLEAMSRGLPSVITFCGPEEAVVPERTGLCAPPEDPDGLAAVLDRLVRDPSLRAELGEQGSAYVRTRFSSRRVADDLLAVYMVRRVGSVPAELLVSASPPTP
jgi:glycosyltransferase involved in cell wall biosynthesis